MPMRRITVLCAVLLLGGGVAAVAGPDKLTVGGITHEGQFMGFDNNILRFRTDKWKDLKEQITRVTKLTLDRPYPVAYFTTDKKGAEPGVLKGYDRLKFVFDAEGTDVAISYTRVKKIEIREAGGAGAADAAPAEAGAGVPVQTLDVEDLSSQPLSPAQRAALNRYKTAKTAYDQFVAANAALVNQMNKATGTRRDDLLNQLRKRKYQEQPLKTELANAQNALVAALESGPAAADRQQTVVLPTAPGLPQVPAEQDPVEVFMK